MITKPDSNPIKKRKLSDDVQERLQAFIVEHGLKPGDHLPSERDLMQSYQVGRPAIREAMQSLQRMGLITIRHGERPRVAAPDMHGMIDQLGQGIRHVLSHSTPTREHLRDARIRFEAEMARIAAIGRSTEDIAKLQAVLEEQREASSDPALFVACDGALHRAIASISGNPIYEVVSGSLFEWLSEFHVDLVRFSGLEQLTLEEHQAIVDAIIAAEPEAASEAMILHLTRADQRYRQTT